MKAHSIAQSLRGFLHGETMFWRLLVTAIFAAGLYSTYVRFFQGLAASTNLSNTVPWGLWVGLNTLCGVGLSAGGFAIAAAVYVLGVERYRPVLRASILLSFLGYLTVVTNMFYELGLPWRVWHPIIMWNTHSVLFEVAWCVMLYTSVLALEFAPAMFERLRWTRASQWHHRILIVLVVIGVLLSSEHQSFLGGLYLITKGKLHPLWYSTQLPAMFFISAIAAGLAMVIMVMHLSVRRLGVRIDQSILRDVSRVVVLMLAFYALVRASDMLARGEPSYLWKMQAETGYFWLEIALLIVLPLILYNLPRVNNSPQGLYFTSALVVMGFMANRINVSITGLLGAAGVNYVPKWTEFAASIFIFTLAILAFRWAVLHLPIFPRAVDRDEPAWSEKQIYGWPEQPAGVIPQAH
jgi:Ni/Fe-hydrogenase subunit HybB-like protein